MKERSSLGGEMAESYNGDNMESAGLGRSHRQPGASSQPYFRLRRRHTVMATSNVVERSG